MMRYQNIKKIIYLILVLNSVNLLAQERSIIGVITTPDSMTLPGASITEKGTTRGTQSDQDGKFSLKVSGNNAVLVVSYVGYLTKEVQVNDKTNFNIIIEEDAAALNEVVVIGYGSINKRKVTGSVAKVNADMLNQIPDVSFQNKLSGKLAGVNVQQTTGAPGGNISIQIRGIGSITGGNDPLVVIDGFPVSSDHGTRQTQGSRPGSGSTVYENSQNPLNTLNPNDIESVEVLKDAAAASIYGSRGANGVILITTKRGAEGKPTFSFSTYFGTQVVSKTYSMMDAYEFAEQNYIARANAGTLSGYPTQWLPYLNDEPGLVNTDWQDALFREAPMMNYDFSAKGGNKTTKYYISGNYTDQEGIIIGSGIKRYAMRVNLDSELSDKIRIGANLSPSLSISDLVPSDNPYFVDGVVNLALLSIPTEPIYNADGTYNFSQNTDAGSGPFVNPIAIANLYEDKLKQARFLFGTYLELDFLKDFKFKTQIGGDFGNWNRAIFRPSTLEVRGVAGPSIPTARNFGTQKYNWLFENTLSYAKTINEKHNISTFLGYTAQKDYTDRNGAFATNFPDDFVQTIDPDRSTVTSAFTAISESSLVSLISRVLYDYDGKYLFSASIRRDGSSRFGKNTKYGNFPSVSVGWRISDESFFKSTVVNDLKIRASYGVRGNDQIGNYSGVARLGSSNYIFDDQEFNGLAPNNSSNQDLSWERNVENNYGLDVGLFNNKLVFNADYFISTTKDLLFSIPVPGSAGTPGGVSLQNIGSIENRGFELGVTNNTSIGELKITTNANISTIKNKILKFGVSDAPLILSGGRPDTYIAQIGQPIGSYYGYNVLGVFTSQEELDTNANYVTGSFIGDFKFEDVNNDGVINASDRKILGNPIPDYTFGFTSQLSYKNVDFSFGILGKQGFEILHLAQRYLGNLETFSNYRSDSFNNAYISPENPGNGKVYRPNGTPTGGNAEISSYHVEDGSFVRIQNITVGYSFSKENLKKFGNLKQLRIYATAVNPFTFTKYSGYNPDVSARSDSALTAGEDYGTYPLAKNFIFGLNVSF